MKKFTDKQLGKIAALFALFLAVFAFTITLFSTSISNNLIMAYTLYTAGMFVPVIAAFIIKKPEKYSKPIVFISIFGILLALILEVGLIKINIPSIIICVVASSLILLLYMFFRILVTPKKLQNNKI